MPCDQRITTSVVDLMKVDRKRLSETLAAEGWHVKLIDGASHLRAWGGPYGATLFVTDTEAQMTTNRGADVAAITAGVRMKYAERTVAAVSKRFGFKMAGSKQLANGAKRLMLRR